MQLSSRFGRFSPTLSLNRPLTNEEIAHVAPSIYAREAHESRSQRYTYIPTIEVLEGLRREGFQPFMVTQTRVRDESKREHTKHMLRLRHESQIGGAEANEIVLLNSHDGTSSYQMLAGMLRFVCKNGLICGEAVSDIRVPHKGDVVGQVIEGAFTVLNNFDAVAEQRDAMKSLALTTPEQTAFARAALELRYGGGEDEGQAPTAAPVAEDQLLRPRRWEDRNSDLWTTFNTVQENIIRGGMLGRTRTGRPMRTRAVQGIDQNVKLNRALWVLANEMRRLRA